MKKIIFLTFVFSTSSFSGFSPSCDTLKKGFYRDQAQCEISTKEKCYYSKAGLNCAYNVLVDVLQDDKSKPIYKKTDVLICADIADCDIKFLNSSCTDSTYTKIKNYDSLEVYCYTNTGFQKKPSGKKQFSINPELRDSYQAAKESRQSKLIKIYRGSRNRLKCRRALDFVSGFNDSKNLTEEQIDEMETFFESILDALSKNRIDKARRLINLVSDPSHQDLKHHLLEILK